MYRSIYTFCIKFVSGVDENIVKDNLDIPYVSDNADFSCNIGRLPAAVKSKL